MDFDLATLTSGSRFVFLRTTSRIRESHFKFYGWRTHQRICYQEISPPLIVSEKTMFGTGQLPKFENDQFELKLEKDNSRKIFNPNSRGYID